MDNNMDYYKILGINSNSNEEEIKMAYKKLAMKYHPDKNPNNPEAEEKFKEIKNAYESLINKDKQKFNNIFSDFNFDNINFSDFVDSESGLDDVFRIIFSKEFGNNINDKIISTINIDLEQALYGSVMNISFFFQTDCIKCAGRGFKVGEGVKICSKCSGSGIYLIKQGVFAFKQKCFKCDGKGYASVDICKICNGDGKVDKDILCEVNINPYSDNDSLAPLKYIGEEEDISFNDYYVSIKIKPHAIFLRKDENNNDIYCKFIIDFIKAIFGGYIKIYTLYGYIKHKIRKGSQSNEIYKLKELGLDDGKGNIGDFFLEIFVEIPLNINLYQNLLIKKLKLSIIINENNYPLIINLQNLIDNFYINILKK